MSYLKRLLPRLGGYKFNVWVERRQSEFGKIVTRNYVSDNELQGNRRFFSQSRQLRDSSEADPIRAFDSQPSLRTNSLAMSEYLKTLQKVIEEESSIGGLNAALRNLGRPTKVQILGTESAPFCIACPHEGGGLMLKLWEKIYSAAKVLVLAQLLLFYVILYEDVKPSLETSIKFSDVKGLDEAKAELEEIVHYLKDPKGLNEEDVDVMIIARSAPICIASPFEGGSLRILINRVITQLYSKFDKASLFSKDKLNGVKIRWKKMIKSDIETARAAVRDMEANPSQLKDFINFSEYVDNLSKIGEVSKSEFIKLFHSAVCKETPSGCIFRNRYVGTEGYPLVTRSQDGNGMMRLRQKIYGALLAVLTVCLIHQVNQIQFSIPQFLVQYVKEHTIVGAWFEMLKKDDHDAVQAAPLVAVEEKK